jgi:hypothetical protein
MGNSFDSFNVRLYAYQFSEKVAGIILMDSLYEIGTLQMSFSLSSSSYFFVQFGDRNVTYDYANLKEIKLAVKQVKDRHRYILLAPRLRSVDRGVAR